MSTLFEDLQEGLLQAIAYANGNGPARTVTLQMNSAAPPARDEMDDESFHAMLQEGLNQAKAAYARGEEIQ